VVDLKGFEPLTSSMPWKRAPNCATGPRKVTPSSIRRLVQACQGFWFVLIDFENVDQLGELEDGPNPARRLQ
jgi:hypothetical protein